MDTTSSKEIPHNTRARRKTKIEEPIIWSPPSGPWDLLNVTERGEVVDAIMKIYFNADNWMLERNKQFPGLI